MGCLEGRLCYISSPIELSGPSDWREDLHKQLYDRFIIDVFDPVYDPKQNFVGELRRLRELKDYNGIAEIARRFVKKDLGVIERSDFVIAVLPYRVPTCGTHAEICLANQLKKPILLVCPDADKAYLPLWYFGYMNLEMMFGSFDEVYDYLKKVDNEEIDYERWHFVMGKL